MSTNKNSGGIGCLNVTGIVFLVLKILSVEPIAHWSWIWVLSPFWIPTAIVISIFLIFIIISKIR
jgi:small Trp-rich protein